MRKIEADELVFTWSTGMDIQLMLAAIGGSETKEGVFGTNSITKMGLNW